MALRGRAREDYVRPPLVPHEPGSASRATWRFRVIALALLVLVVLVLLKLFLRFSGIGTEDPGLGGAFIAPRAVWLTAL